MGITQHLQAILAKSVKINLDRPPNPPPQPNAKLSIAQKKGFFLGGLPKLLTPAFFCNDVKKEASYAGIVFLRLNGVPAKNSSVGKCILAEAQLKRPSAKCEIRQEFF